MESCLRKHIEKIVPLTDDEFAGILSHFTYRHAVKKAFLIKENENVPYNYFIVSGLVKLSYNDDKGKEHIVSFAMEDWWESDYQAFYKQTKTTLQLQCLEDTSMFCLTLENYRRLCASFHKMEHFFMEKAIGGHIASQRRILSFITLNAKDRYEQFLSLYPSLTQRISRSLLASYLGVSRETMSRLF